MLPYRRYGPWLTWFEGHRRQCISGRSKPVFGPHVNAVDPILPTLSGSYAPARTPPGPCQ